MDTLPPELVAFALQVHAALDATLHVLASSAQLLLIAGSVLVVVALVAMILLCLQEEEPALKTRKRAGEHPRSPTGFPHADAERRALRLPASMALSIDGGQVQ